MFRLGFSSPAAAGTALLCLASMTVLFSHEPLRAARVLVLMAPLFVWLRWPVLTPRWRAVRLVAVSLMLCTFIVDSALRAYMLHRYQAVPESSMVLAAVANTNGRESLEYVWSQGDAIWWAAAAGLASLPLIFALTGRSNQHSAPLGRFTRWGLIAVLALACIGMASKPWRRYQPIIYWTQWVGKVAQLRSSLSSQEGERAQLLHNAASASPTLVAPGPNTVVWVITDSVNRDNMSLYGYARDTTPHLKALSKSEPTRWLTLEHAWSAEAGTLASLSGVFSFGMRMHHEPAGDSQHILALARAAGYRIWWMSNHDDIAIDQQHAQLAHHVEMVNRQPGRGSASLDSELLDCLEEALRDQAPHKLIVVHMLGAHPDYSKRVPANFRPFDGGSDAVNAQMKEAGRPLWLRELRERYDAAITHHDEVVSSTLRLTRRHTPANGQASWLYLSDHGQEVGHSTNRAGHSASTPAGYRIPALAWRSQGLPAVHLGQRPFRADWTGWLLSDLLQIQWQGMDKRRNVLDPGYVWEPPALPLQGVQFDR